MALLLAIAAALAAALYMFVPPKAVSVDAPATEFSTQRAMKDVRVIADAPHPMGSEEHEAVADYLVGRLEELGLTPQVQEISSLRYDDEGFHGDQVHAGRLKNIIARIPGTDTTSEAVLLVSHYDSMPTTPAAADGAVSTATLLETVRAIQAGPPLKNDVIVYVGDADVNGVLGPIAFHKHPWSRDTGVGFAFEGIGSSGPSALVYEGQGVPVRDVYSSVQKPNLEVYPSTQNGWWLEKALEVLPRPLVVLPLNSTPFAGALSPELGLLQVGTDAAGLGFGQFRGSYVYHTILDNPERLEPRSLQHQGQNALSLARHFGNLPLDQANRQQSSPLVAFNVLPGRVVSYPSTWALPLAVAITLLFVVVLVFGIWRGRLKVSTLLLGFLLFIVSLVGTVVVTVIGCTILDGPPGSAFFTVRLMEPNRVLVLYSDSHLRLLAPRSIRENPRYGIYGGFSWAFVLEEKGERNTRLIVRTRASYGPRLYRTLTMPFVLVGGEFLTTRKMLHGIRRRVERTARQTTA